MSSSCLASREVKRRPRAGDEGDCERHVEELSGDRVDPVTSQTALEAALRCVHGCLEVERGPRGVTFHRVPSHVGPFVQDPFLDLFGSYPSGVRLEMLTDAAWVELTIELTQAVFPGFPSPPPVFDLEVQGITSAHPVVDRVNLLSVDLTTFTFHPSRTVDAVTIRFELGEADEARQVCLWFPVQARLELLDVRASPGATVMPAPVTGARWVHHGSSISQCSEALRPTETWPAIVARRTGRHLTNLGIAGECQLDPFMARAIRDLPADLISLELGINVVVDDSMRERVFVSALHGFLETLRDGHPVVPILVISPTYAPPLEDHPGPGEFSAHGQLQRGSRQPDAAAGALTLTRVREILEHHIALRRAEGDPNVHYLDGLTLFGPGDVDALPDLLHPSPEGYTRMAERLLVPGLAFG